PPNYFKTTPPIKLLGSLITRPHFEDGLPQTSLAAPPQGGLQQEATNATSPKFRICGHVVNVNLVGHLAGHNKTNNPTAGGVRLAGDTGDQHERGRGRLQLRVVSVPTPRA